MMSKSRYAGFGMALVTLFLVACSTFQASEQAEKLIVQVATMRLIEADKDRIPERAAKVRAIASDAKKFFDSGAATVDQLESAVIARIEPLNLSPSDRLLANMVVAAAVAELRNRVGEGLVPPEKLYAVTSVLNWIDEAASLYP